MSWINRLGKSVLWGLCTGSLVGIVYATWGADILTMTASAIIGGIMTDLFPTRAPNDRSEGGAR